MLPHDHEVVPALRAQLRQWNLADALRHYDLYALKATVIACAFNVTLVRRGFRRASVVHCVTTDAANPAVGFYEGLGQAAGLDVVRTGWEHLEGGYRECRISMADSPSSQADYQQADADWQTHEHLAQFILGDLFGYPECCVDAFTRQRTTYQGFLKAIHQCSHHDFIAQVTHVSGCVPCHATCSRALACGQQQWAVLQAEWGESLCSLEAEVAHLIQEVDYRYLIDGEKFSVLNEYARQNWQHLLDKYHDTLAAI